MSKIVWLQWSLVCKLLITSR